ncbi:MAG: hypothetical protein HYY37_02710 [Candidatus Aenigmarchaeota archaeon]|nr:hypothetical protein [Candidatus Aenigmarchaeota archaeon]
MRHRVRIVYDAAREAYKIIDSDALYNDLSASHLTRKMKQYPSDTIVHFESVPKSVQNQLLRAIRHR